MTPHLEAAAGDYAEAILLPGDPLRAQWIAETFLEAPRCVNRIRGCLGFTGTWNGRPVSVQATGMGQPSTAIYVHELMSVYGAKVLIRVGTCGGLDERVKVRDLVIAQGASTNSAMNRAAFAPYDFAPIADFGLLRRAVELAEARGAAFHVGGILSDDVFYHEEGLAAYATLRAHGILGVEMETSALYTLAAKARVRALTICTMSDCIVTGAQMSPAERQGAVGEMARLALDVAVG